MVATVIIAVLLAAVFILALVSIFRKRMGGDCGCGACSTCQNCSACKLNRKEFPKKTN